jgi:hypothetical protein
VPDIWDISDISGTLWHVRDVELPDRTRPMR